MTKRISLSLSLMVAMFFIITTDSLANARYCNGAKIGSRWTQQGSHFNPNCFCRKGTFKGVYHHTANSMTATSKAVARRQCIRAAVKVLKARCLERRELRIIQSWNHKEVGHWSKWKGGIKYRGWCKISYSCRWIQKKENGFIYNPNKYKKGVYSGNRTRKSPIGGNLTKLCGNALIDAKLWAKKTYGNNFLSIRAMKKSTKKSGAYKRCTVAFQVTYKIPTKKEKRYRCVGM